MTAAAEAASAPTWLGAISADRSWWVALAIAASVIALVKFVARALQRGRDCPPRNLPRGDISMRSYLRMFRGRLSARVNPERVRQFGRVSSSIFLFKKCADVVGEENVEMILRNKGEIVAPFSSPSFERILGPKSLFFQSGERHKKMRKALEKTFTNTALGRCLPIIEDKAREVIESWDPGERKAKSSLQDFTFHVVATHALNLSDISWRSSLPKLFELFKGGISSLPINFKWTKFGKGLQAREELLEKIRPFVQKRMEERKRKQDNLVETEPTERHDDERKESHGGGDVTKLNGGDVIECPDDVTEPEDDVTEQKDDGRNGHLAAWTDDVIAHMIEANSDGLNFTADEITDQALFVMFAGHDTTSRALSAALAFLGEYPECVQKLREEQRRIRPEPCARWTMAQVKEMRYLDAFLWEVMRCYHTVQASLRYAKRDFPIDGVDVPEKWVVRFHLELTSKMSPEWKNPDDFDPERFLGDQFVRDYKFRRKYFKPFGIGERMCPGKNLARLELKVFVGTLIRTFDVKIPMFGRIPWSRSVDRKRGYTKDFTDYGTPVVLTRYDEKSESESES